jgi:hypothetical protein
MICQPGEEETSIVDRRASERALEEKKSPQSFEKRCSHFKVLSINETENFVYGILFTNKPEPRELFSVPSPICDGEWMDVENFKEIKRKKREDERKKNHKKRKRTNRG